MGQAEPPGKLLIVQAFSIEAPALRRPVLFTEQPYDVARTVQDALDPDLVSQNAIEHEIVPMGEHPDAGDEFVAKRRASDAARARGGPRGGQVSSPRGSGLTLLHIPEGVRSHITTFPMSR